jgi:hypothetical protein
MISVVVPFNAGNRERDRNWAWVRARYEHLHPTWELVEHADTGSEWSKGRAVRAAVDQAAGDLLVIADADVFISAQVLYDAANLVELGEPWVIPHDIVYRLSEVETVSLTARSADIIPKPLPLALLERRQHPRIKGGGIVVCTREGFERVGGIDPRFTFWGGEDISFARALDTLVGPHVQLRAPMWHLHHARMSRRNGNRASMENEELAGAYKDAEGHPDLMDELVRGNRDRSARNI